MVIPKINSAHGSDTRNILNRAIDLINVQGKSIQELVAEGQLTPEQYTELIQTVNGLIARGEVSFDDININKGKLLPKHLSEEVLEMVTGNAPVNATPADGSITTEKVAKKAIEPINTNFIKVPNNLINKHNVIENKTLDASTGLLVDSPSHVVTDFIKVNGGDTLSRKNTPRFYVYSDRNNDSFINSDVREVYTVSPLANYVRFSILKSDLDTAQVNKGNKLEPYDEYVFEIGNEKEMPFSVKLPKKSIGTEELKENSVKPENTTFINISHNLFNKDTALLNKVADSTTGNIVNFNNNYVSEKIPVEAGKIYTKENLTRWVIYRSDDSYLATSIADTYTMPPAASYVRVNGNVNNINNSQVVEGDTALPYESYGEKIDKSLLPNSNSSNEDESNDYDWKNDQNYIINGEINGFYKINALDDKSDNSADPLKDYNTQDFYELYDNLMAEYPDFITRTLLGNDASDTFPIYRYDFQSPTPDRHGDWDGIKKIKVILVSGSHPEKAGMYCMYKALENILENPKNDPLIDTLKQHIHFIVLPVWGPWNVENATRWNSNNVNIGRNFPEEFVVRDVGDTLYGGTEPLSEPETRYLYDIFMENKDALFHIDFHNFFTATGDFLWVSSRSLAIGAVGEQHVMRMTGEWKKEYPEIPQEATHFVGYATSRATASGSNHTMAESLGIRATTYEVSQQVYFEDGTPRHSVMANTLGTEAFINFLLAMLKYTVNEKNSNK